MCKSAFVASGAVGGVDVQSATGKWPVWRLRDMLDKAHFSATLIRIVIRLANWKASRVIANCCATRRTFGKTGGDLTRVSVAYPGID